MCEEARRYREDDDGPFETIDDQDPLFLRRLGPGPSTDGNTGTGTEGDADE